MSAALERIIELAELKGRMKDEKFRALLRRLARFPDPGLEQMLLRKLTVEAGDEAVTPLPFRTPCREEMSVPGTEGLPYVTMGSVARLEPGGIRTVGEFRFPLTPGHSIFLGETRMGKTMAVRHLVEEVLRGNQLPDL